MSNPSITSRIGSLRLVLLISTVICYPLVWLSDVEPEGIGVLTAYVVPALIVIFFFLLLLDALMNRVFMIEQDTEEVKTRRLRMWLDLAAVGGILLFWGPYFQSIGAL